MRIAQYVGALVEKIYKLLEFLMCMYTQSSASVHILFPPVYFSQVMQERIKGRMKGRTS